MHQAFEDGVYMDNSVYIVDEKKQSTPLLIRVLQMLFILFGTWCTVSMLIEALSVPCKHLDINIAVLIFSVIIFSLYLFPSYDLVKLFFCVLFYGLFVYSRGKRLLNAFYILENRTLDKIDAYYGTESIRFVADYTTQTTDTTLFMIMILILIAAVLALAVMRNRLAYLGGIILLIPAAANFALGFVPSERYLVTYMICTTYLISQTYRVRYAADKKQKILLHKISSRAAAWLCMLGLMLFFILKIFVSKEEYDSITKLEDIGTEMQTAIMDFSVEEFLNRFTKIRLFPGKASSTGLDAGLLGTEAQIRYLNEEHLQVVAPKTSIEKGIYLRGYIGSIYTGDRWIGHSEGTLKEYDELMGRMTEVSFQPVNQANLFLKGMFTEAKSTQAKYHGLDFRMTEGHMSIKYSGANKQFLYAPYFTNFDLLKDLYYNRDLYAAPNVLNSGYEYDYFYDVARMEDADFKVNLQKLNLEGYVKQEKDYRNFVYKAYTRLPEKGLEKIKKDFSSQSVQTRTGSTAEKIEYVRNYLEKNTRYSLSPGKLPRGKDFTEYFLYENKKGYCAHYATAATLMLRAMGIPARYAEGYAFGKEAILQTSGIGEVTRFTAEGSTEHQEVLSEVSVMDYNAHAWVEVYFDYCGWYPVEFTPGSLVSYNQSIIADIDQMGQEIFELALLEDLEKTQPTPEIPDQYQPIMDDRLRQDYVPGAYANRTSDSDEDDLIWLMIVSAILAGGFLLVVIVLFVRGYRKRNQGSRNKRAFAFYSDVEKILRMIKGLPDEKMLLEEQESYVKEHCVYIASEELDRLMELVRRARFGRKAISPEELAEIVLCRNVLYRKVYQDLSAVKRLTLKILLAI